MSKEFETLEEAQRAIRTGERARILFEMLLSEIGLEFENTHSEVWIKLREVQEDYESAIKHLSTIIKQTHIHRGSADIHPNEQGVSVSN